MTLPARGGEFSGGIRDTLGPRYHAAPKCAAQRMFGAARGRLDGSSSSLERDRDRRQRARPHARGPGRGPRLRRAARARPREPGDGDRPHRDLRCGERDRRRLPELHRPARAPPRHLHGRRGRPGRARHAGRRSSRRRRRASTRCWPRTSAGSATGRAQSAAASSSGTGPRPRDPRAARQRRLAPCRAARRHRVHPERSSRASGARTRSARSRSRWARTGARSGRSSWPSATQFRVPPPPRLDSAAVRGGLRRGEAPGRRRRVDADRAHRGPDARSASTGPTTARRACARRRGSTTRSPCRSPTRAARTSSSWRGCWRWSTSRWPTPASPSGSRSTTTRSGGRSPASARPTRAPARPAPATAIPTTAGDPTFTPLGAPASNLTGPNFTPPFPAYPSATPASAARCSRPCAGSTAPTNRLHLRLGRVQRRDARTTTATCGRSLPRSFASLLAGEEENGQSRIYLGIHWAFDKTEGIAQGRRVADTCSSTLRAATPGMRVPPPPSLSGQPRMPRKACLTPPVLLTVWSPSDCNRPRSPPPFEPLARPRVGRREYQTAWTRRVRAVPCGGGRAGSGGPGDRGVRGRTSGA